MRNDLADLFGLHVQSIFRKSYNCGSVTSRKELTEVHSTFYKSLIEQPQSIAENMLSTFSFQGKSLLYDYQFDGNLYQQRIDTTADFKSAHLYLNNAFGLVSQMKMTKFK